MSDDDAVAAQSSAASRHDPNIPQSFMAAVMAGFILVIAIILMVLGYFLPSDKDDGVWNSGLYLLGGAVIVGLFAYVAAISEDRGVASEKKVD